jgi:hypothetical protein
MRNTNPFSRGVSLYQPCARQDIRTDWLISRNWVFIEKLAVLQLLKKFPYFVELSIILWDMWQGTWSRHYATNRKVAGSITDEVIGFFNLPNPSSLITDPRSTQPLAEMSTSNIPGSKERPERKANLTVIWEPIV